jgi:tetratricopeptide (TPR) repeat protein
VKRIVASVIFLSLIFPLVSFGQVGVDYDLKKPPRYEDRSLGYEKTTDTKWTDARALLQNTITQYNWYFNTNNKLNEVLARAKAQFREDYTQLLPFYNYTLEATSKDKRNLDSVLDKVNSAVLLHDLRNSWNDNLYMLMGRAYFYKNNLDSAHILFQFVNYAYAPRDPDGYPIPIGSNADGGNAFTVSTDEKTSLVKKVFTTPPSRNESFIWQIRTYFQQDKLTRGAVLIEVLKEDPNFPARLKPSLHEMQALWNYKIKQWDSAAYHLSLALDNTTDQGEAARWEYLIAQLYERSNNPAAAKAWFEKASTNTLDPALSVYARLNAIRDNNGSGAKDANYIQKNLNALMRMARKEIYQPYLDVIYYVAAEMELERNDRKAARIYYKKCIEHANGLGYNRDRAFLKLGWIFMEDKMYPQAKYAYDSVNTSNPMIADSLKILLDRKIALSHIVPEILIIQRQDSLQMIAAMTPAERDDYIKKMLRAYRRQQGLKEEDNFGGGSAGYGFAGNTPTIDMFSNTGQGDWYFYNQAVKASGYNNFKSKWGNRPNVDNWEVQAMINRQVTGLTPASNLVLNGAENTPVAPQAPELTAQKLLEAVPLTPEKLKKSQDSVEMAFFILGKALQDYIPDYRTALKMYDSLETRFPDTRFFQEALFDQYYCYLHLNDSANAARILAMMKQRFPSSRWLAMIQNPSKQPEDMPVRTLATRAYENVYEQMIEGHFDEAAKEKLALDSTYGEKYWTPQLLYVEAVYYIHYRYDSIGKVTLNTIITKYTGTTMAAKAKNLLRVLNEREKIENYLRNLHVNRMAEDSIARLANAAALAKTIDSAEMKSKSLNMPSLKRDSSQIVIKKLDAQQLRAQALFVSPYTWSPDKPQSVVLVMNKVDPVYVTESKNAFDRYDRENFYGKNFETSKESINDSVKLMIIHGFEDAAAALTYLDKAGNAAPREIIPWLPAGKYYFIIIDDQNLQILKANMDMQLYKRFLQVNVPDKFPAGK